MGKYDPLRDRLATRPPDMRALTMSFDQIEELVRPLPRSARTYQAWWVNTADGRVAAQAWRAAGWHIQSADRSAECVVFARDVTNARPVAAQEAPSVSPTASDGALSPGHAAESKAAPAERRAGPKKMLSKRAMIWELAVGAVAATVAGVSGLVGLTQLPWPALLLLSVSVGGAAFTIT